MAKEIKHTEEGLNFSVEFLSGHPIKVTHKGKHWPRTTQCIIKRDGLIVGVGSVTKHVKDNDNPKYAKMYAAKKAFINANYKVWQSIRKALWEQILKD